MTSTHHAIDNARTGPDRRAPGACSPNPEGPDSGQMSRAAALLADTARELAALGATADDVSTHQLRPRWAELAAAFRSVLSPPDRAAGYRVLSGVLEGFDDPGPTPRHWRQGRCERTRAVDLAVLLLASLLGRPFAWPGQQDGRMVHNILPSRGYEHLQVGASSSTGLAWHSEDAFHARRAELVLLACIRNEDQLGSRVAAIRAARLDPEHTAELCRPLVSIAPDDSYPDQATAPAPAPGSGRRAPGIATIWHAADGLCVRYDPSYSKLLTDDARFVTAYRALGAAFDECGHTADLSAGDVLLIDNDVAVHGRASFQARYDGTDRWLKRALIRLPRARSAAELDEPDHGQTPLLGPGAGLVTHA